MKTITRWLGGLISAASGALAGIAGLAVADPATYLFDPNGTKKAVIVAGFTALAAVLNYLKQSPLPGVTGGDQ